MKRICYYPPISRQILKEAIGQVAVEIAKLLMIQCQFQERMAVKTFLDLVSEDDIVNSIVNRYQDSDFARIR